MGKTTHEKSFVDFDKPYEQNIIGLRGIVFFGIGLFLLIVVAFGLMAALQSVMEDQAADTDKANAQPMALKPEERLPPEPRLQAAPGFGVDSKDGRISLELTIPQAEYRELKKQWDKELLEGQKQLDQNNKEVQVTLPVSEAKAKFLEENAKTSQSRAGDMTAKAIDEASTYYSYSSSGRLRTDRRK